MSLPTEGKSFTERLFAWGSVSYAFGFLIVLLHTSRLGLPVIELLNPVLVWIGAPLALFLFFSSRLVRFVRQRITEAGSEVALLNAGAPISQPQYHSDVPKTFQTDQVAREAAAMFSMPLLRGLYARVLKWSIQHFVDKVPKNPETDAAMARASDQTIRAMRVSASIVYLGHALISVAVLLALLGAYAWIAYPQIPQSAGGGKPARVSFSLKSDAVPDQIRTQLVTANPADTTKAASFLTDPVELLYNAKDAIYVRTKSGNAISIGKGGVVGAVWSQ